MWAAWRLARVLAVKLVEEEWMERAQRPTEWPKCKKCDAQLRSKGFVERYLTGLMGTVRWERRVGRCPHRCKIGQVAPLDTELGLQPNQRISAGLQRAACALAVFVPFEVAAVLLSLLTQVVTCGSRRCSRGFWAPGQWSGCAMAGVASGECSVRASPGTRSANLLVEGKRLRDISDLPFDLAV